MLDLLKRISYRITGRKPRIPCPECRGVEHFKLAGEHRSDRPQSREVIKACNLCNGRGYLTSESEQWIKLGAQLKEYRVRKGMSQSDFAHRYGGLKQSELDAIEKGYRNPAGFIAFLAKRDISIDAVSKSKPHMKMKKKSSAKKSTNRV